MSSRYTNPTIINPGIGYTATEIAGHLPATVAWQGQNIAVTWSNLTVNASGQLTGIRLYHGSFNKDGTHSQGNYLYTTRNLSLPAAGTAVDAIESYGSAIVVSGKSVVTNNQNAQGADAINIAKGLANQTYPSNALVSRSVPATITAAFTIQRMGTTIAYTKIDGTNRFGFTVSDGLGGSGLGKVYKEVSSISDLPTVATNFFKVKVAGDIDIDQDDYYVEFSTGDGSAFGDGTWGESAGQNVKLGLDNTTMPMKIVSTGIDTAGVDNFTLSTVDYDERKAGDDDSNPAPSFVNSKIENMFYYKDRLGFLSRENIILSEVGQPFSFYRTSVTSLLDSDVIDVAAASGGVTKLKAAVGFQDNLILFSENGQFSLKGGDILTPRTVSINPITNFGYSESINPMLLGSLIYYPFTRGAYSGLREFTVNSSTDVFDSQEITEHVPAYIPKNILDMAGTSSENIIALVSSDDPSCVYIYNYFWNNNQKVLSAWSKFTFTGEVRGLDFIDSTLHAVTTNNGETNLVEMPMESGLSDAAGYVTHLDMRVATAPDKIQLASVFTSAWTLGADDENLITYNDASNLSVRGVGDIATLTIPDTQTTISGAFTVGLIAYASTGNSLKIKDAGGNVLFSHAITSGQNTFSYTPTGSEIASSLCIYRQYDDEEFVPAHRITLSEINIVSETADGNSSTILLPYTPADNTVQVYTTDGLSLNCTNSGATVTLSSPLSTDTDVWVGIPYTMKYTFSEQLFKAKAGNGKSPSNAAKLMIRNGSLYFDKSAYFKVKVTPKFRDTYTNIFTPDVVGSSVLGSLSLDSGFYRFPVFTKAQDTTITIENESALPSTFQSAEFESFIHTRSNRYG